MHILLDNCIQIVYNDSIDETYNSEKYNVSAKGFRDILRSPNTASALWYVLAKLTSWDYVSEQLYSPKKGGVVFDDDQRNAAADRSVAE